MLAPPRAAAAAPRAAVTPAAPTQPLPRSSMSLAPTQGSPGRGQGREKSFFPLSWLSPGMSSAPSWLLGAVPTTGGRGHRCEIPGDGHGRQASRVGCSAGGFKTSWKKRNPEHRGLAGDQPRAGRRNLGPNIAWAADPEQRGCWQRPRGSLLTLPLPQGIVPHFHPLCSQRLCIPLFCYLFLF